jgi:hypothetical protein
MRLQVIPSDNGERICGVCGEPNCGSQNVEWDIHDADDGGLTRADHLLKQAMSEYRFHSQLWDRCDRRNFDNVRKEVIAMLDEVIEDRLREIDGQERQP